MTTEAGTVYVSRGMWEAVHPPYTNSERNAIIKQGRDRPRPLSLDETTRAAKNRRVDRETRLAMEVWYRTQCIRNGHTSDH
jgi:hypothetical protein